MIRPILTATALLCADPAIAAPQWCEETDDLREYLRTEFDEVPLVVVEGERAIYALWVSTTSDTWTWTRSRNAERMCVMSSGVGTEFDPLGVFTGGSPA